MSAPQTYPVSTVAQLLLLTPRRVQQLANEGVIPKAERGRYQLVSAVQGYIRYLKSQIINGDTAPGGDAEHKRRLLKARADIAEMEAERLAGDVVLVGQVTKTWTDLMAIVRQSLLTLAPETSELVAVEQSIEACHEIIETHVHKLLAHLAATAIDGLPEADPVGESGSVNPGPAPEDHDLGVGGPLQEAE